MRRGRPIGDTSSKVGAQCHLERARVGTTAYLVLVGELDLSCTKRFSEALRDSIADRPEDLVVDLRSVTFVDSTGLAMLLKIDSLAREEGIRLHMVRSPIEIVRAVFEATGIDKILPLVDESPRLQG
jgi:anti-anti-sigma factor